MKKYIANYGAKKVKQMIENKATLKEIKAFCLGFGFNINSYKSAVTYIEELNKICITIRRKNYYYYIS
jgi:hypothetical protein